MELISREKRVGDHLKVACPPLVDAAVYKGTTVLLRLLYAAPRFFWHTTTQTVFARAASLRLFWVDLRG
jgi:hypothetical protein